MTGASSGLWKNGPVTEQQHTEPESAENQTAAAGDDAAPAEEQPTPQLTRSQVKRLSQPMIGMVITMLVTVAAVGAFILMNPEPDVEPYQRDEDVHEAAGFAADTAGFAPLAPDVPEEWSANYARWENRAEQGVSVWEVGYTTGSMNFVGFSQTDEANPTWISAETHAATPSGTTTVEGVVFEVLQGEDDRTYYVLADEHNEIDQTAVVLGGDATEEEFETALRAVVDSLGEVQGEAGDDDAGDDDEDQGAGEGAEDDVEETEDD